MLKLAVGGLVVLPLSGCFCGQFFRGPEDVVAVTISPTNSTIQPASTQQFTATGTFGGNGTTTNGNGGTGDVTSRTAWTSSNGSVATINEAGLATGVKTGTVTITGECECYTSHTSLTVSNQAVTLTSIAVTPASPSLQAGLTQQFVATGTYSDASTSVITTGVTWTSSDQTVATVNSSGVATAVASGSATITATLSNVSGATVLTVQ